MLERWRCFVGVPLLAIVYCAWNDTPATPRFEGTRVERYAEAMRYYQSKMGTHYDVHVVSIKAHPKFCAWVMPLDNGPNPVNVQAGIVDTQSGECAAYSPERLALHESCHLRMMHVDPALIMSDKEKHAEVRKCMRWYGGTK
jgi:hypothetical protein